MSDFARFAFNSLDKKFKNCFPDVPIIIARLEADPITFMFIPNPPPVSQFGTIWVLL